MTTGHAEKLPLKAHIVPAQGTDEEIAARCAEAVGGWADLQEETKAEMVGLMRRFASLQQPPRYEVENDRVTPKGNPTLHSLRTAAQFASASGDYCDSRTLQLTNGSSDAAALSARLAFVQGAKAEDTVQSSLATQMALTHDAALRALRQCEGAQFTEHAQLFGNLAAKLLNTYARQAEALAKLQRGGSQVVKVIHVDQRSGVHVGAGGQAIVAETINNGGVSSDEQQSAHAIEISPEVLGYHADGHGVPIPSGEGQETVPDARGRKGIGRTAG